MADYDVERAATTEGVPVDVSIGPALAGAAVPAESSLIDRRTVAVCGLAVLLAGAAALVAQGLVRVIWLATHLAFYGRFSFDPVTPPQSDPGWHVLFVPVVGGLIVGLMARYGSRAIRGHGIPEAMEQVLQNESRIRARMTFLKPLSAAVAIGTGGPFGAEGPIIATGGAMGSVLGQVLKTAAAERKTLLAAGAAAGMAATFGSPVSAVLLAVELLLFEYRPRSIVPVALATATAAGVRLLFEGAGPAFAMPDLPHPAPAALLAYVALGALMGAIAVLVTRAVYAVEDAFERLPIHWAWWPAIGGLIVGAVGLIAPRTLGVGYYNISQFLSFGGQGGGGLTVGFVLTLCALKFASWVVALGSGTSGGTLAPLFTIGGGLGLAAGAAAAHVWPGAGIDPRVAALVGMAALFAGASRALLASVVFAFETTLQPFGLLPLLGGCAASFLVSAMLMRNTIMTEKIVRRGVRVPAEYHADFLDQVIVEEVATKSVVSLRSDRTLGEVRAWIAARGPGTSHQGFPVVDEAGILAGVVTRRHLLDLDRPDTGKVGELITRPPVLVYADSTLRAAADHMVRHDIGRLPVVRRGERGHVVGFVTRSDLLGAHRRRLGDGAAG